MYVPYVMRGLFYPSHLSARCPGFHPCEFCHGCRNAADGVGLYAECSVCESGHKTEHNMICRHTEQQILTIKRVNRALGRPMSHPDWKPGTAVIQPEPGEEVTHLAQDLYGGIQED